MNATRKTFEEMTEIERQDVGKALWNRECPRCQSGLIDELVKAGEMEGFTIDDIENLMPDPSGWGVEQCRDYIRDHSGDMPSPDPWSMDRAEMVEALTDASIECRDDESDDTIRAALVANIDEETIDGIDEWRDAVNDCATPAEVYEWWEVGDWLAEQLADAGEVVIRNGYGDWWGRCCTGQAVYLDYTIQRLGAEYCAWALDK